MVISGSATVAFKNGKIYTLKEGDLFYIPPEPHDSWVVGDEEYVSLHFLGAEKYADWPHQAPHQQSFLFLTFFE